MKKRRKWSIAKDFTPLTVRLEPSVHELLMGAAQENLRSLNSEINARLKYTFELQNGQRAFKPDYEREVTAEQVRAIDRQLRPEWRGFEWKTVEADSK